MLLHCCFLRNLTYDMRFSIDDSTGLVLTTFRKVWSPGVIGIEVFDIVTTGAAVKDLMQTDPLLPQSVLVVCKIMKSSQRSHGILPRTAFS